MDSVETRGSFKTNRGAMFGLDARIALAIFGALSVISGAALYSAIKEAKLISIITQLNELGKAYDQYYLDTGEELDITTGNFLKVEDLITNTKTGWKGPYLPLESKASHSVNYQSYSLSLHEARDGAWSAPTDAGWTAATCTATTVSGGCYVWTSIYIGTSAADLQLAEDIDKKVDGSVNYVEGDLRIFKGISSLAYYALLKYRPSNKY